MADPITDPRADGSEVPAYVVDAALRQLRGEALRAAEAWERYERSPTEAHLRAAAAASRAFFYRYLNAGVAVPRPREVSRWRRVWAALVG